jgi:acetate kinase
MNGPILVINAGSSSIKFSGYEAAEKPGPVLLFKGQIEGIGLAPHMSAKDATGANIAEKRWPADGKWDHEALFDDLFDWLEAHLDGKKAAGVGHRVVHGGSAFAAATRIDPKVIATLQSLCTLAPLHQSHHLAAIRAIAAVAPSLPQVACFDTAFHHGRPWAAQSFALPRELAKAGVIRYGFHGLSYEYIASVLKERAPRIAAGRVVVAHLGAGASMCAMLEAKSVDTTMGFTALDGLPMGTRCGALDPGVLLYFLRERGMNADQIEQLLYHKSGLLGVSGLSSDMRELERSSDPRAKEAIELFVFRIARELGALTATLGGLDGLVFTAGIGEHSPEVRRRVCEASRWLGITLDREANARGAERISAADSRVSVWTIPTDEEWMIARQTVNVLSNRNAQRAKKPS